MGIQECNNVIVSIKATTYRTWEDMVNDDFVLIRDGSSTAFIPPLTTFMNALIYNIEPYVKNMDNEYYQYLDMFKYYITNHDQHQVGKLSDMMITGNLKFTNEYVDGYTNSIEILKKVKDLYE